MRCERLLIPLQTGTGRRVETAAAFIATRHETRAGRPRARGAPLIARRAFIRAVFIPAVAYRDAPALRAAGPSRRTEGAPTAARHTAPRPVRTNFCGAASPPTRRETVLGKWRSRFCFSLALAGNVRTENRAAGEFFARRVAGRLKQNCEITVGGHEIAERGSTLATNEITGSTWLRGNKGATAISTSRYQSPRGWPGPRVGRGIAVSVSTTNALASVGLSLPAQTKEKDVGHRTSRGWGTRRDAAANPLRLSRAL